MSTPVTLRNLTPHEVVLHAEDGTVLRLPPADTTPRLLRAGGRTTTLTVQGPDGATRPVTLIAGDKVTGTDPTLPAPTDGVLLVTSRVVAEQHPIRTDLVWPDDLLRDDEGRVSGARRLASLHDTPEPGAVAP